MEYYIAMKIYYVILNSLIWSNMQGILLNEKQIKILINKWNMATFI